VVLSIVDPATQLAALHVGEDREATAFVRMRFIN
jgi:hypothetical protein